LIKTIDRWAFQNGRRDVFAQIGKHAWKPQFIAHSEMLCPDEFKGHVRAARVVIGHAGMGTILTALQHTKPVLVMPRRGAMGETRNDHQLDTANHLSGIVGVDVALDEDALMEKLGEIDAARDVSTISIHAEERLTSCIHAFIQCGKTS
jgi:UDP-N-acetylglucosamine transferase subunit ALG13